MDNEVKETVLRMAEYDNEKRTKDAKVAATFFVVGIAGIIINQILFHVSMEGTFWTGLAKGISAGVPIGAMIFGLSYMADMLNKLRKEKERIMGR